MENYLLIVSFASSYLEHCVSLKFEDTHEMLQ